MSKRFVRVKRLIIPVLTAALLLSTSAPAFALSVNEVAALDAEGVAIEVVMPQAAPMGLPGNIVAQATSTESDFRIKNGVLQEYIAPFAPEGVDVVIPDGVTKIGDYAFGLRTDIRSVIIPDSVTEIGSCAFESCTGIKELMIPSSVVVFGLYAIDSPESTVIICEEGSAAQEFAEANGFRVSLIGSGDTSAPTPTETPTPVETPAPTEGQGQGTAQVKQTYTDVPPDFWGYEAIEALSKGGLLQGYGNGTFGPQDPIHAGELATILCRIGGLSTDNADFKPEGKYTEPYNWAHMALRNVWDTQIYMVKPEYADRAVIRGEAITALAAVAGRMPKYHEGGKTTSAPYIQVSEKVWTEADIPDWEDIKKLVYPGIDGVSVSEVAILKAYNLGIVSGVDGNGTCAAGAGLTRAELCQILYNMGVTKANQVDLGGAFFSR